jgi:hypothetical protein
VLPDYVVAPCTRTRTRTRHALNAVMMAGSTHETQFTTQIKLLPC